MKNPFSEYIIKPYNSLEERFFESGELRKDEYWSTEKVFSPEINYKDTDDKQSVMARIGNSLITLYTTKDLLDWKNDIDTENHFKGLIGERILAITMHSLLEEITSKLEGAKFHILREQKGYRGEKLIANVNDKYIIKFNNTTSLVVLYQTMPELHPFDRAMQRKFGLNSACEIDGLGFFEYEGKRYVLVGESSAKEMDTLEINSWKKRKSEMRHIFDPLSSLFPDCSLIYVMLSYKRLLFDERKEPSRIKTIGAKISEALRNQGIMTIPLPYPKGEKTLRQLAIEATEKYRKMRMEQPELYLPE